MKVSVFSFAVNDRFPIDIAHRQYQKYLKDDFNFVVFNDAFDQEMEQNINTITAYNKINCVRVPQHIHKVQNPSEGYASTLNWAVHQFAVKNNCEIVVLTHTDIFPIQDVSILSIIGNNIVASTTEYRRINEQDINYLYPAFTIINMKRINPRELDFSLETGLDTGGKTHNFIRSYPDMIKFISNHPIPHIVNNNLGGIRTEYFVSDLEICKKYILNAGWVAEGFFHYMAGSQWNAENPSLAQGHKERMDLFLKNFY